MSAARPNGRGPGASRTAPRTAPRRSRSDARPRATAGASPVPRHALDPGGDRAGVPSGSAGTALLDPPEATGQDGGEPMGAAPGGARSRRRRGAAAQSRTGGRLRAPRHRLLLVCTAVLGVGLFGVLLLNTIISQGAFRQHELEVQLILTAEKEEALSRAVQQAEAPIEVEKRARALGMVPAGAPVFLRLSDGRILGTPVPAPEPTGPVDFADAPGLQEQPPTATSSASPGAIDPALDPATGLAPAPAPSASVADPSASPAAGPGQVATAGAAAPGTQPGTDAASPAASAASPAASAAPDPSQGVRP